MVVNKDVKAKQFEAVCTFCRTKHVSCIADDMLAANDSFNDAIFDLLEQEHIVMTHEFEPFSKRIDAPLGACAIICRVSVILKVRIELIQTVVRQVHILLLPQVPIATLIVLLGCKARQAILVNIEAQRVD